MAESWSLARPGARGKGLKGVSAPTSPPPFVYATERRRVEHDTCNMSVCLWHCFNG